MKARRQCIEEREDIKYGKNINIKQNFILSENILHTERKIFFRNNKKKKNSGICYYQVCTTRSQSYLGKRKIIPAENMGMQEKIKNTRKDKYVGRCKLTLIL